MTSFSNQSHSGNTANPYRPVQLDAAQAYSVPETAAALGISVSQTWAEIRSGSIPTFSRGRRRLVLGRHIIDRNLRDAGVQP